MNMESKTLATTPPLLLLFSFFFHLRGAAFGSSKPFHCLLLLSCLLLSSVHTLHNLPDYVSFASQSFNGVTLDVSPTSHLFSLLPALASEYQFDPTLTFFRPLCPAKSLTYNNLSGVVWFSLKPVHIIEFHPFIGFSHIGGITCYKPLSKKNTRELSILVSGKLCEGLPLEQGDSTKYVFFYQTQLSGVALFAVPMKATAPILMLSLCKKPISWMKKLSVALLIAVALLILIFCFNDHCIEEKQRDVEKTSTITISPEMDSLLRSINKETLQGSSNEVVLENNENPIASSSSQAETSEAVMSLTVKTAKDKKRRRNKKKKKKKKGVVNELTSERTDVSRNSTPRSPMTPVITQDTSKPPKPVSSVGKSMIIQGSSLAPNARAPGAKTTSGVKEEYKYDIWGDHLTGLQLMDRFKQVREGRSSSDFGEDECESFFVKGPPHLNYLLAASPMDLIMK